MTLSGRWTVITAKATPFISCGIQAVPFPVVVMSKDIYTGTLSWLTHPTNNYSPDSATNGACIGSHINSSFAGLSAGAVAFAYSGVTFVTGVVVFAYSTVVVAYDVVAFVNGGVAFTNGAVVLFACDAVVLFACGAVVFAYGQWCSR